MSGQDKFDPIDLASVGAPTQISGSIVEGVQSVGESAATGEVSGVERLADGLRTDAIDADAAQIELIRAVVTSTLGPEATSAAHAELFETVRALLEDDPTLQRLLAK
jgi:high-affinity K+ transport system ATPase subunit B